MKGARNCDGSGASKGVRESPRERKSTDMRESRETMVSAETTEYSEWTKDSMQRRKLKMKSTDELTLTETKPPMRPGNSK